jgi:hypothetical protein
MTAAQQVRGVVVEDSTNRPIADAKIELLAADSTVRATSFSAATGWFELFSEGGGQILVRASHAAYSRSGTLAIAIGPQEIINVVLRLSGGPIPLEPLVVSATRDLSGFSERARRRAFGHFITRADIDKLGGHSLSHVLRFTPEVRIEAVRDGPFTSQGVFMRTYGDLCVHSVYLDGVPVPTGSVFGIDGMLPLDAVVGIEVYRSALSAPMQFRLPAFGANMTCGVIAVWSRPLPGSPMTAKRAFFAGFLVGSSFLLTHLLR